ncbi:VOC family protein [Staphylococcus simulans]|uniref:VOC family protein n=1 Tax=Staphylococcus simulans TaxID=1286 RepID=UPI000D1EB370|nr:VOC family protein [Staphylococcus simulans]PTJ14734.1 glyoxalase/bleomycin resistance/extradiol dioxygenase family protein [Staphylococcus simulans]
MIQRLDEVMLYVNDQETAKTFWTEKLGFTVSSDTEQHGMRTIVLRPSSDAQTGIVLHNKQKIQSLDLGISTETPSLMFATEDIEQLYQDYQNKGITVGDLVDMPQGKVFNFADDENNYFAVKQI